MTMTIYELDAELQRILNALEELGASDDDIQAACLAYFSEGDMADKVDGYCRLIGNLDAEEKALREEAARLSDRAKTRTAQKDRLKTVLQGVMAQRNLPRVQTARYTVFRTKGRNIALIQDAQAIPETFCRVIRDPDKSAILAALLEGIEVPGAVLGASREGLTIK